MYQNAVKRFSVRVEEEEGARRVEQVSKDDGASCCLPPLNHEQDESSPGRTRVPCEDSQSTLGSLEDSQLTVSSAEEAADSADVEGEKDSSRKKGEKRVVFPEWDEYNEFTSTMRRRALPGTSSMQLSRAVFARMTVPMLMPCKSRETCCMLRRAA